MLEQIDSQLDRKHISQECNTQSAVSIELPFSNLWGSSLNFPSFSLALNGSNGWDPLERSGISVITNQDVSAIKLYLKDYR